MSVMHHSQINRVRYSKNHLSGGAKLDVPKTPVEKIMLSAKMMNLKRDFLRRQAERGS